MAGDKILGVMWVAAAIVFSVILLLVDRHQKWGVLLKVVGGIIFVGLLGIGYLWYDIQQSDKLEECATKVRATYPGTYQDMDDLTLAKKVLAKYPTCELPAWAVDRKAE